MKIKLKDTKQLYKAGEERQSQMIVLDLSLGAPPGLVPHSHRIHHQFKHIDRRRFRDLFCFTQLIVQDCAALILSFSPEAAPEEGEYKTRAQRDKGGLFRVGASLRAASSFLPPTIAGSSLSSRTSRRMIYVAVLLRDLRIRPIHTAPVTAPLPARLLKTKPSVQNGNFPPT